MKKQGFEFYLSKAIERKLQPKADELGIMFSVKYKGATDTSHVTVSGNADNYRTFTDFAGDLIIDNTLSSTVKYKYV